MSELVGVGCNSLALAKFTSKLFFRTENCWDWWEQSAKLKAAKALIEYFESKDEVVPDFYKGYEDFFQSKKSSIEDKRTEFWRDKKGNGRHPDRWTDKGLPEDAKKADELRRTDIDAFLDTSLNEFYQTQMERLQWISPV